MTQVLDNTVQAADEPREMTLDEQMLNDFLLTLEGGTYMYYAVTNVYDEFVGVTIYDGACLIARIHLAEGC